MQFLNKEYIRDNYAEGLDVQLVATRDAYGEAMVELGKENDQVVALNADLESSVRLTAFREAFPSRSIQVGVAEQNMASIATGLALYGKIPFMSSFAAFSPTMNLSQIRLASLSQAHIKVASTHYGVNIGEDGSSAQMLEDVGFMRSIPNVTIITPVDALQTYQAVFEAAKLEGVVYLRFTREKFPLMMREGAPFEIGKGQVLRSGDDVTIIATGSMLHTAIESAKSLQLENIGARVINIHTIKPIDTDLIATAAKETNAIVTIEEHQAVGGLGSAVAEVVSEYHPAKIRIIGVDDEFGESGTPQELYESKALTVERVEKEVKELL